MTLVVADAAFAGDVEKMLEADFAASPLAFADEYAARGPLFRAAVNAARLFEPSL